MNNASIHYTDGICDLIGGTRALLMNFLPYSPNYSPIEEFFSKLKTVVEVHYKESDAGEMDTKSIVYASLAHITAAGCQNWISDSKIYNY